MVAQVIVLENESTTRMLISDCLRVAGIQVTEAADSASVGYLMASHPNCLVILPDDLPRPSLSMILDARDQRQGSRCIFVMRTDGARPNFRVDDELAVDAYLPRAISVESLVNRIESLLGINGSENAATCSCCFAGLTLEPEFRTARYGEKHALLGPTECKLLQFLIGNPERVFSRSELIDRIWDRGSKAEERTIDVHILRLRRALTPLGCEHFVQTVPRFGYRFSAQSC